MVLLANLPLPASKKVQVVVSVLFLTEHHAMKAYWGSGGIAPRIDLGTRWRRVVSFTPRPLYPQGKSPWYPLDRRLSGPQNRSGRGGEEKNALWRKSVIETKVSANTHNERDTVRYGKG
jgi:hypothetical protein